MKIVDRPLPPAFTLDDVETGNTVRLKNGKVYLIGYWSGSPAAERVRPRKVLINLQTGATHSIQSGTLTECTVIDAEVHVP